MPLRWVGRALEPVRELVLEPGLEPVRELVLVLEPGLELELVPGLELELVPGRELEPGLGCRPRRCRQWRR